MNSFKEFSLVTIFIDICVSFQLLHFDSNVYVSTRVLVQNFHAMFVLEDIPQTTLLKFRPKPESSGLEVEANLDFKDKNVYSQCFNFNKQGIYLQVNY